MENLSDHLVTAIEQGQPITEEQLEELIAVEAKENRAVLRRSSKGSPGGHASFR